MNTDSRTPEALPTTKAIIPLRELEAICASYGMRFIPPVFPQLMDEMGEKLCQRGWLEGYEAHADAALEAQAHMYALSRQSGYRLSDTAWSNVTKEMNTRLKVLKSENSKNWEACEARTYFADNIDGLLVYLKYRKLDWGYMEISLSACFPESCRNVFLHALDSPVWEAVFDQQFSDKRPAGPFDRMLEGKNKFRIRDSSQIQLSAISVFPHNVQQAAAINIALPAAFMQLEMYVNLM